MSDYELALAKGMKVSRAAALLEQLKKLKIDDEQTYFRVSLTVALVLLFVLFVILTGSPYQNWISLFVAFSVFSVLFNLPSYLANRYREELESHLIPALYAAARMPKGTPASKVIARLAELKEFGLLSELFENINSFYSKASGRYTLAQIFSRYSSTIGSRRLERMFGVLNLGLKHNRDANSILLRSAEDLEDVELLSRQRQGQLTYQKFTLLFSSAILLPGILSAASGMLSILASSGVSKLPNPTVLLNALLGYTLIEAVLAAIWISYSIEDKRSSLAFYLPTLTLLAMAVFLMVGEMI